MGEFDPTLVRSGTWGHVYLDDEVVAEAIGLSAKIQKNKEPVVRCGSLSEGHKLSGVSITGTLTLYNATSRLIKLEGKAIKEGRDLQHTIISLLDDPDNPQPQRIVLYGVSFDDLTLADWKAAELGRIEAPFTADRYDIMEA